MTDWNDLMSQAAWLPESYKEKPMKTLIITPTTGIPELVDALTSVKEQELPKGWTVEHMVVVDGPEFVDATIQRLEEAGVREDVLFMALPYNTGGQGFYGHKIYASTPQLAMPDVDYIMFLDEDNWYTPNHVAETVSFTKANDLDFGYSLRSFYNRDGSFYSQDNCASLGKWKIWDEGGYHLIDTGAYCFKREFIARYSSLWNMGWGVDINFIEVTRSFAKYDCTKLRTFCYRLGAEDSAKYKDEREFIDSSNAYAAAKYGGKYPWDVE